MATTTFPADVVDAICRHMNDDHAEDALLICRTLGGVPDATRLVLLDEPTAALDLRHAETTLLHLRRLAREGSAIVVVLHDLNLAGAHADRVAVVSDGRLAAHGHPHDVLTEPLLSEAYGHDVDVVGHPRTGLPVIFARR